MSSVQCTMYSSPGPGPGPDHRHHRYPSLFDPHHRQELCSLRSLDFGGCADVTSIEALEQCTRLEELVLDGSGLHNIDTNLRVLASLPNLAMLNVHATPLSADKSNYRYLTMCIMCIM